MKQAAIRAYLDYFLTRNMGVICSSETSVDLHRIALPYISDDRSFHNRCCENLIYYVILSVALYDFEIMSATLREENKSKVESKVFS
jgi:hypothetical protein